MIDNLEQCRNRGLRIAPRKAQLLEDATPQQQRIARLHQRNSTQEDAA